MNGPRLALILRGGSMVSRYLLGLLASAYLSLPVYTTQAFASPRGRCENALSELQLLRKAQNQIITSLAQNHDVFADQLSDLSFELAIYKKSIPPKALTAMEKSAQAYRLRSQKAFETADRLDASTADLIKKIQSCLK